ncbi:MAG: Aspartyl/glutamyl-tRNA(Asn/Gln) amidotransferase subunit C [Candidatus Magasanikbacteria bacterium GW2011_GWC2_40_17]|uniref:Aspartyl/glutamyl-tRNA(Asn/Gln) amidotransferase subunit C n=1 Tax=Candidatus Magasanikbacteria bacterium GW2011_GWA2_42_32 TaxID=1619039 RepID=A0A0G1D652_9BACT|nr:MAG: Aspartyl/glutamyl-tRNA(Asn/Gln) amidotransferase subunit C [Candidatus Magasanikbacteria bacterium GW2011_GWC2_40_17]KKS57543.1 MAG: Aspartyl/glutamyl-tRNA(Asn/Gln) amidotransferase subunit C [Candidatus Magasanikbacteria bacterium GW2011_GWA2_42_32]OGH85258.1 MAG: hypothetical protein A2294_00745 [Candidatus Magasanikbacteria bacterium RIFOXYB2_FULL_38_10]
MPVSKNLIDHLADLAKLELTAEEKRRYFKDLSSILGYVEKIQALGVKEEINLIKENGIDVWRKDEIKDCSVEEKEQIIKSFPEKESALLKVPGVFE